MPSFYLIHERKLQSSHEELMRIVAEEVPALVKGKTKVPLVTDEEYGICNSIDLHLLSVQRLQCWNPTLSAAKVWLRNHNATSSEIPVYVSHLRDLFHQPSEQDYNDHYEMLRNDWSKSFCDYFDQNIHTKVKVNAILNNNNYCFYTFNC